MEPKNIFGKNNEIFSIPIIENGVTKNYREKNGSDFVVNYELLNLIHSEFERNPFLIKVAFDKSDEIARIYECVYFDNKSFEVQWNYTGKDFIFSLGELFGFIVDKLIKDDKLCKLTQFIRIFSTIVFTKTAKGSENMEIFEAKCSNLVFDEKIHHCYFRKSYLPKVVKSKNLSFINSNISTLVERFFSGFSRKDSKKMY